MAEELRTRAQKEFISGWNLCMAAYASNSKEQAFEFLELAFDQRAAMMLAARIWPSFDAMREDPRFEKVIARMQFPPGR